VTSSSPPPVARPGVAVVPVVAIVSGPSPIAGTGLFTTAAIAAGATVARFDPGLDDGLDDEAAARALLAPGTAAGLGNHSCDPTLGWADASRLVALRDLPAGAELTCDYSTLTTEPGYRLNCHCETYRCRGLVSGEDWQIPELQRRYAGHWLPSVQRRITAAAAAR
jgi:hypothetical protein